MSLERRLYSNETLHEPKTTKNHAVFREESLYLHNSVYVVQRRREKSYLLMIFLTNTTHASVSREESLHFNNSVCNYEVKVLEAVCEVKIAFIIAQKEIM